MSTRMGGAVIPKKLSEDEDPPPTIDMELLERLSRWSASPEGLRIFMLKGLGGASKSVGETASDADTSSDSSQYLLVSLLAGTQIYLPSKQRALLLSAENPDKVRLTPRFLPLRDEKKGGS